MKNSNRWGTIAATVLLAGNLLLPPAANAEIRTYEGVGEYVMSDFETADVAKQRAKARAEQNAQETAGVFVNSYTKVNNLVVTDDEIITIASGIMSVVDTSFERSISSDGILFRAKIKANIDTDEINKWLEKGVQERSAMAAQNKELQEAIAQQNKEIADLKRQLVDKNPAVDVSKLKTELTRADNAFLANQKIEEGNKFYFKGDYRSSIANYSEALGMNPKSTIAYRYRGTAYANVQDYSRAAEDFSRAISLEPDSAAAYVGRGASYICLKEYHRASVDLTKAIELEPSNGMAYYNRGICYQALGDRSRAQEDFARANSLGIS